MKRSGGGFLQHAPMIAASAGTVISGSYRTSSGT
jgi:hypothetical protein